MTVFFDVDTQRDFVFPAGSLYVPGAERILPNVTALNRFASTHGIALISTTDAHEENDPEFHTWPPHCVVGTFGQRKPESTVVDNQILFEKVTTDAFANPKLKPLLDGLQADRYVVYGVVTEICVRAALQGLAKSGSARIELVTDAIRGLNESEADATIREFMAAGGVVTTTSSVVA